MEGIKFAWSIGGLRVQCQHPRGAAVIDYAGTLGLVLATLDPRANPTPVYFNMSLYIPIYKMMVTRLCCELACPGG